VLVGESGSGKTMALRMLAGLVVPDEGKIELEGETYYDSTRGHFVPPDRRSIGYMAQNYALFPHLSALENVAFGLRASGARRADARRRARAMLDRLEVADLADRRPSQMSGGQQQRVALARALVLEPRAILYDEPTTGLDPVVAAKVNHLIRDLQRRLGLTGVVVTHDLGSAFFVADRIAFLHDGRIRFVGPPEEARASTDPHLHEFLTAA